MASSFSLSRISALVPGTRRRPNARRWDGAAILAGYALAFWLCHRIGGYWASSGFYSLWFPAAGVRFALLWRLGARWTFGVALTEVLVQLASGIIAPGDPGWIVTMWGVARPALAYGAAIAAIEWMTRDARTSLSTPPMPFGLAAVSAPLAAVFAALPWSIWRPDLTGVHDKAEILESLASFAVGDLLGVLLLAPALLWLNAAAGGTARRPALPRFSALVEGISVLGSMIALSVALERVGLGIQVTPVLLATVWVGLRFGRGAAWSAIMASALIVLPRSTYDVALGTSMALNMGLASIAVAGYLAGSFADAQAQARATIARRDRMLFQAERLKTLRAMSVAVIHEISQPLSTLAIEARHVASLAAPMGGEIADGAALVDRKASALSELVRRLRRFGGRAVDAPSPLPVVSLLVSVRDLLSGEAKAAQVRLQIAPCPPDLAVRGQEIELAQALVNLARNAVQATSDGIVSISAESHGSDAAIRIANGNGGEADPRGGMGVGLMIARAIIEAHGGSLIREVSEKRTMFCVTLPLAEEE